MKYLLDESRYVKDAAPLRTAESNITVRVGLNLLCAERVREDFVRIEGWMMMVSTISNSPW